MPDLDELTRGFAASPANRCFACGPSNPHGLHLQFDRVGEVVRAEFIPESWHEGWEGVIHGGILVTLLDEAMAYVLHFRGIKGLTARMDVRFRAPAKKGQRLVVEAQSVRDDRRIVDIESLITVDGHVIAEASARFMKAGKLAL